MGEGGGENAQLVGDLFPLSPWHSGDPIRNGFLHDLLACNYSFIHCGIWSVFFSHGFALLMGETMGGIQTEKRPAEGAAPAGSDTRMVVVFQSLDEWRIYGPVGLREWLKRNRPPGGRSLGHGVVVDWTGHQAASGGSE